MIYAIVLVVNLILPHVDKPIHYQEQFATPEECSAVVQEMTAKAPAELKDGGELQVACVVSVPHMENP